MIHHGFISCTSLVIFPDYLTRKSFEFITYLRRHFPIIGHDFITMNRDNRHDNITGFEREIHGLRFYREFHHQRLNTRIKSREFIAIVVISQESHRNSSCYIILRVSRLNHKELMIIIIDFILHINYFNSKTYYWTE